jgi:hypothetical protein
MFNAPQLRQDVIQPTLKPIQLWSVDVEELLILTCANETLGGTYLKQVGGCALSIYQIEPATLDDMWNNFLAKRSDLEYKILQSLQYVRRPLDSCLVTNLAYATVMARVFYLRISDPIPSATDIPALAAYYKKHFNTSLGAATIDATIANYHKFVITHI